MSDALIKMLEAKGFKKWEMSSVMRAIHQAQIIDDAGNRRMKDKAGGYAVIQKDGKTKICPVDQTDGLRKESSVFQDYTYAIAIALAEGLDVFATVEVGDTTTGSVLVELTNANPNADVSGAAGTEFAELLKAMLGKETYLNDRYGYV
jgi:hypothetical protein